MCLRLVESIYMGASRVSESSQPYFQKSGMLRTCTLGELRTSSYNFNRRVMSTADEISADLKGADQSGGRFETCPTASRGDPPGRTKQERYLHVVFRATWRVVLSGEVNFGERFSPSSV